MIGHTLVDPTRNATITIADLHAPTLRHLLTPDRFTTTLDHRRLADTLFLLDDAGRLGDLIPGLRCLLDGRPLDLDHPLPPGPHTIELDRSQTNYTRNWPAFLARRWSLRSEAYTHFAESTVAPIDDAASILKLDTPDRIRRFLHAVATRIHAAPYETYSRYLDPCVPFRSPDQSLDRILDGDGGNCAEKAMALFLIARAHGIPTELVLGGEDASGKFPHRALRSILDHRTFDAEPTRDAQRHWQHYALLFHPTDRPADDLFCDVAGSNIPFLFLPSPEFAPYVDPTHRTPLPVVITLDPIRLFYHRLPDRQDLPLDLYEAMEHHIPSIDLIHTVDNELGLLHTGRFWLGVFPHAGRRDLARIAADYARFVRRAGLDPAIDLALAPDLTPGRHPLLDRFLRDHPHHAPRLAAADPGLRRRLQSAHPGSQLSYALLHLRRPSLA